MWRKLEGFAKIGPLILLFEAEYGTGYLLNVR